MNRSKVNVLITRFRRDH